MTVHMSNLVKAYTERPLHGHVFLLFSSFSGQMWKMKKKKKKKKKKTFTFIILVQGYICFLVCFLLTMHIFFFGGGGGKAKEQNCLEENYLYKQKVPT